MKAYKEWEKKTNPRYNSPAVFYAMERGWKAALKWVLEQETWMGDDDTGQWGIDTLDIEEELNGET